MTDHVTRRLVLGAGAIAGVGGVLAACGDDGGESRIASGVADNALIASFPRSEPYGVAGVSARLPYLIADSQGVPLAEIDGPVSFRVERDGRAVGKPTDVPAFGQDLPRAYLPFEFTFPEPGSYDVIARYRGKDLDASAIEISDRAAVALPQVGEALPAADTPTPASSFGVDPLCTRDEPCPFHSINLRDALDQQLPIVLVVSTPAYCQTAICGPILDMAIDLAAQRPDLTFIHAEVYADAAAVDDLNQAALAPVPVAFGLTFEPIVIVADTAGRIAARGDIVVDRAELESMAALV